MEIKQLDEDFAVCKVSDYSQVDWERPFCFTGKTDEENSLVCSVDAVPANATACDRGWKAFRIQGVLDFSLIGILAELSTLLANNGIGLFAISTYNTDYILIKQENFGRAITLLSEAGHHIVSR